MVLGAAAAHGSTAYFSSGHNVYSYTVPENKWTKLPKCKYENFAMVIINNALTTIGGRGPPKSVTNTLLSLVGSSWEEVLPPMPTHRQHPAVANTPTHLVVAGGQQSLLGGGIATVEVLNTKTLQWSTASSLPKADSFPQMTPCGGCLYLVDDRRNKAYSCSVEDLLKSTNSRGGGFEWTRLASIPVEGSSLATLRGRVLAIGGEGDHHTETGAIHCYDVATNSWHVISEMPTLRAGVRIAVLPSNILVVVGGSISPFFYSSITEIGSS